MDLFPRPGCRVFLAAQVCTLAGFVLLLILSGPLAFVGTALMPGGGGCVLGCAAVWIPLAPSSRSLATMSALSVLGLVGAVAYLFSLADDPTAIPLGSFGLLLLSLVGILATSFRLATEDVPKP